MRSNRSEGILHNSTRDIVNNADILAFLVLNDESQDRQERKIALRDIINFIETTLKKKPNAFSIAFFYPLEDQINNSFLELLSRYAPKPTVNKHGLRKTDTQISLPENSFNDLAEILMEKALEDKKIEFMERLLGGYGVNDDVILHTIDHLHSDVNLLLHAAAKKGCFRFTNVLLQHHSAEANHKLNNDSILLGCVKNMIHTFQQDYDDLVKLFVDSDDRSRGRGFGKASIEKWDPAASRYRETIKCLIAAGAEPGFLNAKCESPALLLSQAATNGTSGLQTIMQEFKNEFEIEAQKTADARKNALLMKTNLAVESSGSYPLINLIQSFFPAVRLQPDEKLSDAGAGITSFSQKNSLDQKHS